MRRLILLAVMALAGLTPAAAAPELSLAVTAPAGAGPVRLDLPAEVLAASRSAGLADLRLRDSTGRVLAMARMPGAGTAVTAWHALVPLPVLGRAGTLDDARLTLRLDDSGRRVAELEGAFRADGVPVTLALLFDTREVAGSAARLVLEGDIPVGQPVRMLVEASADLARWTPVGAETLYRAAAGAPLAPVLLDGSPVLGRYLRLRWAADTPLLSEVRIAKAVLETSDRAVAARRVADVAPTAVGRGRTLAFALPTATPVVAVRIDPAEAGLVVPVRILGRARAEDPWRLLGTGTAARLPGGAAGDGFVPLAAGPTAELKVEAVAPSEGFPTPPRVTVALAPQALLFVASGNGPYRLTVGAAKAEPAWLEAAAFAPVLGDRAPEDLPAAGVADGPVVLAATPLEEGVPRRTLWLGAALGAGVVALAAMAWRLARG